MLIELNKNLFISSRLDLFNNKLQIYFVENIFYCCVNISAIYLYGK